MEDYYSDASGNSSSDYDHENYQLDPQDTQQRPQYQKHHQEPLFMSYLQLKDSRPAHLWEGDTNVFLFFKQFEQQVENIPGISTDIVWEEFKLRVGGLAKRVISLHLGMLSPSPREGFGGYGDQGGALSLHSFMML